MWFSELGISLLKGELCLWYCLTCADVLTPSWDTWGQHFNSKRWKSLGLLVSSPSTAISHVLQQQAEGNGIKLQEAMSLLLSSVWTGCREVGLWSHVWAKASVRSEINYRDIRWYVRLDWTFPVDSFGAEARKEGRKQSRWPPWIKSFVSFFSGAATMPASCETRPPSPFAPLLLSQTLVSRGASLTFELW